MRVYVDRGWYASGEGECLGVVLAAKPTDNAAFPSLVSQWGEDPIWYRTSGALVPLDVGHVNESQISLEMTAGIYPGVSLAENGAPVNIAAYAPNFNPDSPALVLRYRLHDRPGVLPVPPPRAGAVPAEQHPRPERIGTATLQALAGRPERVRPAPGGRGPPASSTRGAGSTTSPSSGVTAPNLASPAANLSAMTSGHTVTAEFQQATTTTPDDLDWVTLPNTVTLLTPTLPKPVSGVVVTYTGAMTFPSSLAVAGAHHRILFKEYEVYATDAQTGIRLGLGVVQVGQPATSYTQRIVYADAIAISS